MWRRAATSKENHCVFFIDSVVNAIWVHIIRYKRVFLRKLKVIGSHSAQNNHHSTSSSNHSPSIWQIENNWVTCHHSHSLIINTSVWIIDANVGTTIIFGSAGTDAIQMQTNRLTHYWWHDTKWSNPSKITAYTRLIKWKPQTHAWGMLR